MIEQQIRLFVGEHGGEGRVFVVSRRHLDTFVATCPGVPVWTHPALGEDDLYVIDMIGLPELRAQLDERLEQRMAGASFCPECGEITSDGTVDDAGQVRYTPCRCETGIDSNGRVVDWGKARAYLGGGHERGGDCWCCGAEAGAPCALPASEVCRRFTTPPEPVDLSALVEAMERFTATIDRAVDRLAEVLDREEAPTDD